jgi:hypothetical protein
MTQDAVRTWLIGVSSIWLLVAMMSVVHPTYGRQLGADKKIRNVLFTNAIDKVTRGREIFRFDTFGDEAFWGGALKLHEAIEGAGFGGIGPGLSPRMALALGLKVDVDALLEISLHSFVAVLSI